VSKSQKEQTFLAKTGHFGLKNGQNQGFAVTDSSTVRFFMLFIPCVLQDIFEKLSCSKG
jgi:hypothetical protein